MLIVYNKTGEMQCIAYCFTLSRGQCQAMGAWTCSQQIYPNVWRCSKVSVNMIALSN